MQRLADGLDHELVLGRDERRDYMGDGVLVYFGYPQAHEDDAERAVRAGLDAASLAPSGAQRGILAGRGRTPEVVPLIRWSAECVSKLGGRHMPRYLSLFKYNAEGRKGLMKEKAAAREAALKLTVESGSKVSGKRAKSRNLKATKRKRSSASDKAPSSAGGKLELINWAAPGSEYSGISIGEFPDAGSCAAVFGLIEATGMFSEIKIIELLTASEIDHGLAKSVTYRAPGA